MCACKREGKGGREGEEGEHEYRSIDVSGRRERPAGSTTPADENAGRGEGGYRMAGPGPYYCSNRQDLELSLRKPQ